MTLLTSSLQNEIYKFISRDISSFNFIQEYALDGLFILDLRDPDTIWLDPKLWRSLGYDPETELETDNWEKYFFKEDLEELKLKIEENINDKDYKIETTLRLKSASGATLSMEAHNMVLTGKKGCSLKLIGALKKINQINGNNSTKKIERYSHIIKGTNIGLWEWNIQTKERIFHEQWANVFGYTLDELTPITADTWKKLSHPDDYKKCKETLKEHLEGKTDFYESEYRIKHKNGEWIWVKDKGKVVTWTEDGEPEWMTGFHEDITEMKERLIIKRTFIENAPSAIAMFDTNMNYIKASNKWLKDYKIEDHKIEGKNHYELFPEIGDKWKEIHQRCLNGEIIKREEDLFLREDGTKIWLNWEVRPWFNANNQIGGLIMHTADISHTKKIEKIAQEKQQFLETILKNINVGIISCDANGKLTLFNKATQVWHGLPAADIPPSEFTDYYGLYKPDGTTPLKTHEIPLLKTLNNGSVEKEEMVIKPKNAPSRRISITGSQLKDKSGKVSGAVIAMHDITELKRKEEELKYSEKIFRHTFDYAATGMVMLDMQGNWVRFNNRFLEITGFKTEELDKLHFTEISHPEEKEDNLALFMECVEGRIKYYNKEIRLLHKNGSYTPVYMSGSVIHDANEQPLYAVSQIIDISAQKMAEERLKNTIAHMEAVFRASRETLIIGTDTNGLITFLNKGSEKLLGYSKEELLYKGNPGMFHVDEELKKLHTELSTKTNKSLQGFDMFKELVRQGESTRYWTLQKKDGTKFPVQLTITSIKESGKTVGYLGVGTDITKLKKTEESLKNTIAKMDAILSASTQTILVGADTNGLLTFFNKGAENLLGYSSKEVVNKETPQLFYKKQELIELAEQFSDTSIEEFKNFDLFAELTKNDRDYTREWTFVKKDGSEFPVQLTITSIKEDNKVIGYLGVGIDISQLKKVENELKSVLKVTQHQNDRLKNFAHIVSHNLRSHSANIEMLLKLLLEENPDIKEDEMLIHLNKASSNLKETISHLNEVVLMNVSVKESLTILRLSVYIQNAIENLKALAEKNKVEIENNVPPNIEVLGVPAYLDSIILNFISNAIKYRSPKRASFVKLSASTTAGYIILEIQDNGIGIDLNRNRRKLFGMYKTFHSNKDARGIGLFITKNQIEAMGGKIEVESELNKGTTFKIYFKYEKN